MKNIKIRVLIFLITFLFIFSFISGCIGNGTGSQGSYSPKILPQAELHVTIPQTASEWSLSQGCYWQPTGTAYNSGNAQADNVMVSVNLVDSSSGSIRDSKTISIGSLAPGASRNFEVTLDGECGHKYSLGATIR